MLIRPETPHDYAAIADLHARAFENRSDEAVIVALLRSRRGYDPELALVAEVDGKVVAHALFSPVSVYLMGQPVKAVVLAPIAVSPSHQRRKIGADLIHEGHKTARDKGFALSMLLGHVGYYPRFGYQTGAFGSSAITIPALRLPSGEVESRPPTDTDANALRALWLQQETTVDFALDPGADLLEWLSPNPAIQPLVYVRGKQIIGYARIHKDEPHKPRMLLAVDAPSARTIAGAIARRPGSSTRHDVVLPLHPGSKIAAAFGVPYAEAWEAAMARSLVENPFDEYYSLLKNSKRPPGRPIWPAAFDLA